MILLIPLILIIIGVCIMFGSNALAWIFHKQKRCTFLSESCPCIAVLTALSVYSDLWTGLRRVRRGECTAVNARTAALGRVASHEHVRG